MPPLTLLALGAIFVCALILPAPQVFVWMRQNWLGPAVLLPLVGISFCLATLRSLPKIVLAGGGWLAGVASGFWWRIAIMGALQNIPGAVTHQFLMMPIAAITIGISLAAAGTFLRVARWPVTVISGITYSIAIKLSDPSYGGDQTIFLVGIAAGIWCILFCVLVVAALPSQWTAVGSRIFGSWLIAIGVLYGALALFGVRTAPAPGGMAPATATESLTSEAPPGVDALPDFGAPPSIPPGPMGPEPGRAP